MAEPYGGEFSADGMLTTKATVEQVVPNQLAGLNLINQWSRHLEERGGEAVHKVAAQLKQWSTTLQPLVASGGDETRKALAPVHEALVQARASPRAPICSAQAHTLLCGSSSRV